MDFKRDWRLWVEKRAKAVGIVVDPVSGWALDENGQPFIDDDDPRWKNPKRTYAYRPSQSQPPIVLNNNNGKNSESGKPAVDKPIVMDRVFNPATGDGRDEYGRATYISEDDTPAQNPLTSSRMSIDGSKGPIDVGMSLMGDEVKKGVLKGTREALPGFADFLYGLPAGIGGGFGYLSTGGSFGEGFSQAFGDADKVVGAPIRNLENSLGGNYIAKKTNESLDANRRNMVEGSGSPLDDSGNINPAYVHALDAVNLGRAIGSGVQTATTMGIGFPLGSAFFRGAGSILGAGRSAAPAVSTGSRLGAGAKALETLAYSTIPVNATVSGYGSHTMGRLGIDSWMENAIREKMMRDQAGEPMVEDAAPKFLNPRQELERMMMSRIPKGTKFNSQIIPSLVATFNQNYQPNEDGTWSERSPEAWGNIMGTWSKLNALDTKMKEVRHSDKNWKENPEYIDAFIQKMNIADPYWREKLRKKREAEYRMSVSRQNAQNPTG